ncbi:YdcH family protein [Rhizobium wuzhouense]|nr:YdcH family protein [Rhizobium wuzhouense]
MKQLLKALKARHSIVAAKIDEEQRRPRPDGIRVRALKKIKLHLKEQITLLERGDTSQAASRSRRAVSSFGNPLAAGY